MGQALGAYLTFQDSQIQVTIERQKERKEGGRKEERGTIPKVRQSLNGLEVQKSWSTSE